MQLKDSAIYNVTTDNHFIYNYVCHVGWRYRSRLHIFMKLLVATGRRTVILEDEILVTKQSVNWKPMWSRDLQNVTLTLTGLTGQIWFTELLSQSLYDRLNRILQIKPTPNTLILKLLEGSDWRSIALRLWVAWVWHYNAYDDDSPVQEFRECGVPLHYHFSQIRSGNEW